VTTYRAYCARCRLLFEIHTYWGYRDLYPWKGCYYDPSKIR